MADRTVLVRLEAVIGPYQRKMAEAAAATRKLSQEEKDLQKATVDLGRNLQHAGAALTIGVTAPLILLAKHAADVAMTAQETENKVTVAFGDMEEAAHRWSEGSAHSMGLARHEAEGAAATFKTMFDAMGLGAQDAFKMSTGVVQLASDLGSFFDVDPSEMLERVRAGLVGEIEPLRRVGILLTDQTTRQKAVELGLATSTDQVSEAAKVQARYALILDQTTKAQGDYARTADSATNASRTARAAYEDAMVELGDNLLPLIAKGAETVTALAEAFSGLPEPLQNVILAAGGVLAAVGPLLIVTGTLIRNLESISKVAPAAGRALGSVALGAGVAIAAFELLEHFGGGLVSTNKGAKATLDDLTAGFAQTAGALDDTNRALLANHLQALGVADAFAKAGLTVDDLYDATKKGHQGLLDLAQGLYDAGLISRHEFITLNSVFYALKDGTTKGKEFNAVLGDQAGAAGDAADAVTDLDQALTDLYDKTFSAEAAADQFNQDLLTFVDTVVAAREGGDAFANSLSEGSVTGLANREMLRSLVQGILDYAGSTGASAEGTAAMRGQLEKVLTQLGFNREEIARYVGALGQIPTSTSTTLTVDGKQAMSTLDTFYAATKSIPRSIASTLVLDVRLVKLGEGVPDSIASPGLLDARQRVQDEFANAGSNYAATLTDELMKYLSGGGPQATSARQSGAKTAEQIMQEMADAQEAANRYLRAVYEHQMELEDNMYRFDAMSKDRYLAILQERLRGLEMYSNEWVRVMEQIQQLEKDTLDSQLAVIEAYEAGRQFQLGFDALASQRMLSSAYLTPAMSSGSSTTNYNGSSYSPTFNIATSDPRQAGITANQYLRNYAALAGV